MSAMSDYLENAVLDHVLRNTAYTAPTTVYVALFTTSPGESGSGTEVSGGAYVRKAVTFGAAASGQISNSLDLEFDQATASWGTVSHIGIMDASTAGNLLFHGALAVSKAIDSGDIFRIVTGELTVSLD